MKLEKRMVEVPHRRVIKAARYEDQDTGDRRERTLIKENGEKVIEQIPVTQRVFFEPVVEDVILQQERFVVTQITKAPYGEMRKTKGGILANEFEEEHHFANEEDARRYMASCPKEIF